jgi:hypothetical protein
MAKIQHVQPVDQPHVLMLTTGAPSQKRRGPASTLTAPPVVRFLSLLPTVVCNG